MAGPQQLASIKVEIDDRGRTVHTFRQSSLGELDICLERGRLTMSGQMPNVETDAANLGTGVHSAIEEALRDVANGQVAGRDIAKRMAVDEFIEMSQHPDFQWVKYTVDSATKFIEAAVDLFFDQVLDRLDPVEVELGFGPIVIYQDEQRVIQITGSIDLFDRNIGAADWKTSGRVDAYKSGFGGKAWEKERWAIQPTVYLYALYSLGYLQGDGPWPFTYFAFVKDGRNYELQELTVYRHGGDFAWLVDKCLSFAELVESDHDSWPKNDNHALCSPTWCPAWDVCKGKFYAPTWPKKPTAPSVDYEHLTWLPNPTLPTIVSTEEVPEFDIRNHFPYGGPLVEGASTHSLPAQLYAVRDVTVDDGEEYTPEEIAEMDRHVAEQESPDDEFGHQLLDEGWDFPSEIDPAQ